MNFKKVIALILALAMVLSLAACGGRDMGKETKKQETKTEQKKTEKETTKKEETKKEETKKQTSGDVRKEVNLFNDIDKAYDNNSDTVGWLYIPDTTINDPIVQAADNDYYLRLTENQEYSIYGCYYADYRNDLDNGRDGLSKNTIIYGHSSYKDNKDDKKFSALYNYTSLDFLKKNPYVYFSTMDDNLVWQVFAAFYVNVDSSSPNYLYYWDANPTDENFNNIIEGARKRSEYIIDLDVTPDDNILTLSTCSGQYNGHLYPNGDYYNYRFVVMAKLLDSTEVPTNCPTAMSENKAKLMS